LFGVAVVVAACSGGDADPGASDVQAAVPDSWSAEVVDDEQVGAFVVSVPDGATRWEPGQNLGDLSEATSGTDWADFWLPRLEEAAVDSNIRTIVTETAAIEQEVVSWQVNVTPRGDDGEFDEPEELARNLADGLAFQGLEIDDAGTTAWNDQTIATVSFRVSGEVFGGEPRFVRQWFFPRDEPSALWSLSCDGPDDPDATADICATALDGFRPAVGTG
ncbi:MAG: hypothetical protein EA388_00940, partial [Nitriliruptor sp.]